MINPFIEKFELDFCSVTIYEDYLYVIMNEGVIVRPEHNEVLVTLADVYFLNKNFIYISHRINSYSVDPTVYLETVKIENLKGFVVIEPKENVPSTFEIETLFCDKPFSMCKTVEIALRHKAEILKAVA